MTRYNEFVPLSHSTCDFRRKLVAIFALLERLDDVDKHTNYPA